METQILSYSNPIQILSDAVVKSAKEPELLETPSHPSNSQHSSQDLNSSITDSDSVASFSESDQGSFTEQFSNSSFPPGRSYPSPSKIDKDSPEIRAVHNVSEQYRRKYLKSCFENLQKEVVSDAKASHLLILTSALDVVQQVKDKDSQIKRDQDRLLEEQRQLQRRLDEVIKELQSVDPEFDVNQILSQFDFGVPENFPAGGGFDRQDLFQIEETVEVVANSQSRKRPFDGILELESDNSDRKLLKMSPLSLGNGKKMVKKGGKGKPGMDVEDIVDVAPPVKCEDVTVGGAPVNGLILPVKRTLLPLRLIDEPDDGSADPDVPLPVGVKLIVAPRVRLDLSVLERRKLATEKGLPLHLASGIPTLPGGNYWSQSLVAFPMLLRSSRPALWKKRVELTAEEPKLFSFGPTKGRSAVKHSSIKERHLHS